MAHNEALDYGNIAEAYPDLPMLDTLEGRWAVIDRARNWTDLTEPPLMDEERQRLDKALLGAMALVLGDSIAEYQTDVTGTSWPWDETDHRLPMLVGLLANTPPPGYRLCGEDETSTGAILVECLEDSPTVDTVRHPPVAIQVRWLLTHADRAQEEPEAETVDAVEVASFLFDGHQVRGLWLEGAMWVVLADVCKALELSTPSRVAARLHPDEQRRVSFEALGSQGGVDRSGKGVILINEPGLYNTVGRSTKPAATAFMRWVNHEVLPALRERGTYSLPGRPGTDVTIVTNPETPTQRDPQLWRLALDTVNQVRHIYGKRQARNVYAQLGLPDVSRARPVGVNAIADAQACLDHLLLTVTVSGEQIGAMIGRALGSGHAATKAKLAGLGIRVLTHRDGAATVFLGTGLPALQRIFDGTSWDQGRWRDALCLLPGIERGTPLRIHGRSTRTIAVPARLIEAALADPVTPRPADPILGPAGPLTLEHV